MKESVRALRHQQGPGRTLCENDTVLCHLYTQDLFSAHDQPPQLSSHVDSNISGSMSCKFPSAAVDRDTVSHLMHKIWRVLGRNKVASCTQGRYFAYQQGFPDNQYWNYMQRFLRGRSGVPVQQVASAVGPHFCPLVDVDSNCHAEAETGTRHCHMAQI